MKTTQLTAILLLFSLSLSLYGQKRPEALSEMSPSFSYSEPEGFSTAIATDKNGRTWIGKADALACYNGSYYLVYKDVGEGSTMINSHVHDLAFDSSGILWIADNRGCQYFSDGVFYDIVDPSLGACMRIMEISDNVMVTTGLLGLVTVGKDGIRNSFYRKGLSFTEYLAVSPHKEVWTATHSTATSTIYVLGQDLEEVAEIPLGSNVLINDFTILEDGSLWVLTNNGLRIFDTATKKEISPDISLKRTVGRDALFVRNWKPGMVLLGVHEKGLSILDTRSLQQQPVFTEEKLSGSSYTCHVTPSEVIWLSEGQSSSVHYSTKGIIPNLLSSLHPEYQFSSTKLRSDSKGQIWIMRGRLLEGFDPATNQILDEIWEDSEFTDIFIDHNDHLWAAFGRTDVREYDISEGRLTLVNRHSYPEETIVSISGDRNGNIWIFLDTCVRMISAKEPQTTVTSRPQHRGSTLTERPGGRLFMIGNDGVNYLCEDSLINIRSLPIPDVISNPRTMLHASDGTTWVGTQNDGVYRFDNNSAIIDHFHTYNGLPDNQIRNVVEGPGGEIWISTRSHITKYSPSSASLHSIRGAGFSSLFPYGRESGVIGNDGRLYFAGDGGVSAIEVDMEIPDNMSKAPEIDFVSINGTPVIPVPKALKLSSKQNNIQICFACPDDTGVSRSGYSIILQGLDRTWRYTNNNEAYFHSLRPGRYEFKVKSLNGGDNSTSLSFKIAYPPLSSIPARILYLVMFLALSFF
ncbi:MAG: hypothetical protein IKR82_02915, partial [Bacteroidales bacterium]|nr:hypothetical protein [Bacteroidales bacterium]